MELYHYITESRLTTASMLYPTFNPLAGRDVPFIWFSANNYYDEIVIDATRDDALWTGDVYRYAADLHHGGIDFVHWDLLKIVLGLAPETRRRLAIMARNVRVSPEQWYGSLVPIPLRRLRLERLNFAKKRWEPETSRISRRGGA